MGNTGGLLRSGEARVSTGKLISAYYLEIEYLLDRIEHAANHYQVLGVERSVSSSEIIEAYQRAVSVLHPAHKKIRAAVSDDLIARCEQAFNRVSEACSLLTDQSTRLQYERSLGRKVPVVPIPSQMPQFKVAPLSQAPAAATPSEKKAEAEPQATQPADAPAAKSEAAPAEVHAQPGEAIEIKGGERPVYSKTVDPQSNVNRRRCERFKLGVPALVTGYDRHGAKWKEVTKTTDVSRMGVGVRMRKFMHPGVVVHVTLPLPTRLRTHGFSEQGYNVYAIVRRVQPSENGTRIVGLEFLGAHPPAGYLNKPWATFRTQNWAGVERRRDPRKKHLEHVMVEYLGEQLEPVSKEMGITEQVGAGGARVVVKSPPEEFELVRVTNKDRSFVSLARICNQYIGKDGHHRLCINFLEGKWPM